jgi:hypothetical protein
VDRVTKLPGGGGRFRVNAAAATVAGASPIAPKASVSSPIQHSRSRQHALVLIDLVWMFRIGGEERHGHAVPVARQPRQGQGFMLPAMRVTLVAHR